LIDSKKLNDPNLLGLLAMSEMMSESKLCCTGSSVPHSTGFLYTVFTA
jgi:hypothetical protein